MFETAASGARVKSLDVLRAAAIFLVLLQHSVFTQAWFKGGWSGVDLFFVLSGFLISGLLFTDFKRFGRIGVGRFLIRRGFKIYPPFYALMAWTVLMFFLYQGHLKVRLLLSELFFLQSYAGGMWSHTWSLAVEEHFYLVLPFLLILLCRIARRREDPFHMLPGLFLVVAAGSLVLRLFMCSAGPRTFADIRFPTHLNVDALLFGVVLSYFYHFRPGVCALSERVPRGALLSLSIAFVAPCFFVDGSRSIFVQTFGHVMLYLGYGGVMLFALTAPPVRGDAGVAAAARDSLAFVGKHSYSIYLWHVPIAYWGFEFLKRLGFLPQTGVVQFLLYVSTSLLLGIATSKLIEIPSLKLREVLFPAFGGTVGARAGHPVRPLMVPETADPA